MDTINEIYKNDYNSFIIDEEYRDVLFKDRRLALTAKEFIILKLLLKNPKTIFTRKMLLEEVWGFEYYGNSRAVDIQIRRLRKKVEQDPANPRYIMTKWGTGYYLDI